LQRVHQAIERRRRASLELDFHVPPPVRHPLDGDLVEGEHGLAPGVLQRDLAPRIEQHHVRP
jgi:hypothetical protein